MPEDRTSPRKQPVRPSDQQIESERIFQCAQRQQLLNEYRSRDVEDRIRFKILPGTPNTRSIVREHPQSNSLSSMRPFAELREFVGENVNIQGTKTNLTLIPIEHDKKSGDSQTESHIPLNLIIHKTCQRLHHQTKNEVDEAMLSMIALSTQRNQRILCTANIGTNCIMIAYVSSGNQWRVRRILPQHHYDFDNDETLRQEYHSEQELDQQLATRCLGDVKNYQKGLSHSADVSEEIGIPDEFSLLVFVVNNSYADTVNEDTIQAVLSNQGIIVRGHEHEYAKNAVERLSRIQFECESRSGDRFRTEMIVDVDRRARDSMISCLVIDDNMPPETILLHHVASATRGPATAKKLDKHCVSIFKKTMAQSVYLNTHPLPKLDYKLRMHVFFPNIHSAIEQIELATIGYQLAIKKEGSGFLNLSRFLPKKGPSQNQKRLESIMKETTDIVNLLNTFMCCPTADTTVKIQDALHDFERKLLKKSIPQHIANIGFQLCKILFYTALSLFSLAMLSTVVPFAAPTFHFYVLLFTGKAVMSSLPAMLTLGVGGGTCLYRTKNAFFPPAYEREMKHALGELSDVVKSVVAEPQRR